MMVHLRAWWERNRCRMTGHSWAGYWHRHQGTGLWHKTRWCRHCGRLKVSEGEPR